MDLNADLGVDAAAIGDDVDEWTNQVTGAGDDVVTNGGFPVLVEGPNSHRAIRFEDGARMAGDDPDAFDDIMLGSGNTWYAVVNAQDQNHGQKNAVFGTLLGASPWTGLVAHVHPAGGGFGSVGAYMTRPMPNDVFASGITEFEEGDFHILAGRLEEGTGIVTAEYFFESAVPESDAFPDITEDSDSDEITIGAERTLGGEHFDGDIARILIYNRPLSETEMNVTGGALANMYGLTWEGGIIENALQPGDADQDFDFDQLDLVKVQVAAKYLTGEQATWGEGDWDGGPGGTQGAPPPGNGRFDQVDIIAALTAGKYLTGPYAAISSKGERGETPASIAYVPEPSTIGMLLLGIVFGLRVRRRTA
jgi:hypothetical protein